MIQTAATIDRRVQVLSGDDELSGEARRVSDLRDLPFVVLLGEPGMGKSTVLDLEASYENVPVLKVRELVTGARIVPGATLFLDGLDEYRIAGDPADKIYQLANAIDAASPSRWRLSCRSEDWRKEADFEPLLRTTGGTSIVVAQLLPLDHREAAEILGSLKEPDPDGFLAQAVSLGAVGFTENPLSIQLLHKAVADGGTWPTTRFALFNSAIDKLVYERAPDRKRTPRRSNAEIRATAASTCLMLLLCGSRAIWRSNDEPPVAAADARAYLTGHELNLDHDLLHDVLDTALFRGEGEAFEPMHRTVAEFLAAQALVDAVSGSGGRAALPLARAIALISGADQAPPTELRGVYAWFAAHLAAGGDVSGATRLINADAVTVLLYGDAAVFDTSARKAILANLDSDDPFFRASEIGITAVGGLAGEDLADEFTTVLLDLADETHRTATVFEVLSSGRAVESVRPLLREIALDSDRPDWHRWRAADAWLNGATDVDGERRELFDELSGEAPSTAREALRAHLAAELQEGSLTLEDVKSLLSDYERVPEDNTIGRLHRLRRRLEAFPPHELFDGPLADWRPSPDQRTHSIDMEHLIDGVLAASIHDCQKLPAERLWRWMKHSRDDAWSSTGNETSKAVAAWLDAEDGRDAELFDAIVADQAPEERPWIAHNTYITAAGRFPSVAVVGHLLRKAATAADATTAERLLQIVVNIVRDPRASASAYWETYAAVSDHPAGAALIEELTQTPIPEFRMKHSRRKADADREEAKVKADNARVLAPLLEELRTGEEVGHLCWAAHQYVIGERRGNETGLDRIARLTDIDIAAAIAEGLRHLVACCPAELDARTLGINSAKHQTAGLEVAVLAGLNLILNEQQSPPDSTSLTVALVVIKGSWNFDDSTQRQTLEQWATNVLNRDAVAGSEQLLAYWEAALDEGAHALDGIHTLAEEQNPEGAVTLALDRLLSSRRDIHVGALRNCVETAAKLLPSERLQEFAEVALSDSALGEQQRAIWSFVAFALDPISHADRFLRENDGDTVVELFNNTFHGGLAEAIVTAAPEGLARRHAVAVRLFGPSSTPRDGPWGGRVTRARGFSDCTRAAIAGLAANPHADADAALSELIAEPALAAWRADLRHAHAQHRRLRRDLDFVHPAPAGIAAALAGGPPVNAADLRAVVHEELCRLRAELHTDDTTPWKRFWNLNGHEKPIQPLPENACRDHLLARLRDRLRGYHVHAALPEARRGESTRADALVLSGAGGTLPVEAKRHYHKDVWTAATTQLQKYAVAEDSEGYGIYVVFWFGTGVAQTPPHPAGGMRPKSAEQLEAVLVADLPEVIRCRTDIVVFDVSPPT